jgi:DHA3 family macrolide efflux protein-like MFS transporter
MYYPGQLKNKNFRKLWISDLLIGFAVNIEVLIIPWLIITKTNSGLLLGIYGAVRYFSTVFAPVIGGVIDGFNKKHILIFSRVYMFIHSLIIIALSFQDILSVTNMIVISFFYGLAHNFDRISREALMQILISKKNLRNATALISSTYDISKIIAPLIGAIIYSLYGVTVAFILVGISYLLAVFVIFAVKINNVIKQKLNIYNEFLDGIKYLIQDRILVSLMLYATLANLTVLTLTNAFLPFISKDMLNGDANDLAILISFSAIGSLLGSILMATNSFTHSPGKVLIFFMIIWHLLMFATSLFPVKTIMFVLLILFGISTSISMILLTMLILSITEKEMIGKIMGIRQLAIFAFPIGLVIGGYMIDQLGIVFSIQIIGGFGLLISIIFGYKSKNLISYKNS